ncbi:MAG: phytoene/squalene synthase family protein [Solirubrobacterales bacterium]|nr:phytoene/squalene synthase family protein [Solirubrobacterales bacterium]
MGIATVAPPGSDPDLQASYEVCRRMHRRHDPTYYWATRRLPSDLRPPTHALYGYVRTADEIVDGPRRLRDPEARMAALDALEAELDCGLANGRSRHPVVGALVDAGTRHALPLSELKAYMGSMRTDCSPVRIRTWEELEAYMHGSAGSVGRIMASLLEVPVRHHADFGRLGLAFQLTNFIRDAREDAELDRIYLPGDDRERFGVSEADMTLSTATAEMRAMVAHEVGRARGLFAGAQEAITATPASVRPGVRIACAVYGRVLDQVEAMGYDVLGARSTLRPWQLPRAVMTALRA